MLRRLHGRRRFLQTTALFSAGLATSTFLSARRSRAGDEPVKALVIGSGFAGSVAALRLGQAGIKTIVIEKGRRWPIQADGNTFATFQNPDGRAAWLSTKTVIDNIVPIDKYTGVLERFDENGISILTGACVGGGSLVYNAITYQPPRDLFTRVFPAAIDYDEMDSIYYPRVQSVLQTEPLPADILATPYYDRAKYFLERAANAGFPTRFYNIAIDWDVVREEIKGTKVASAIIGNHWYGINSGARKSLDKNYLPLAEQTGNVEILPLHEVTEITEIPNYGYRVLCNQINETGDVVQQKTFTCSYLFLAAGSMATSKLLVKAKATGKLPKLNKYIGQGWSGNGDVVPITTNLAKPVSGKGGPSTVVIEDHNNPLGPICVEEITDWQAADGTFRCLGIGIPETRGSFAYDASTDSTTLTWPSNSQAAKAPLNAVQRTCDIIDKRNGTHSKQSKTTMSQGGAWIKNRAQTTVIDSLTIHPLGGAVLGQACDYYGRVYGYKGFYVIDGALIPGSTATTNPSWTIAALAERCVEKIIAEDIS